MTESMAQTMVEQFKENDTETVCQKYPIISATIISVFTFTIFLIFGLIYGFIFTDTAIVMTKEGPVEGFFAINIFERNIKLFYGIPYAEPPVGKLRFEKPLKKKPWNKLLKATKQPNACPQSFDGLKNLVIDSLWKEMEAMNMSEDCLYLNLYVSSPKEKNLKRLEHCHTNKEKKTVMVYLNGWSFENGANSFKYFDSTILAAFGDVIVVVPNYRIGILGFLSSQPEINGNFGLYDQLEALKWVQRNIAAFGGNPDNVVLFGQNSGAISIGLHLISPLSRNLFRRAILESGNTLNMHTVLEQTNAKDIAIKITNTSDCPFVTEIGENETEIYSINEETVDCLKKIPFQKLIEVQNKILANVPFNLFTPVVDGKFFVNPAFDSVVNHKFGPISELLIGSNAMEGVSILRSFAEKFNISLEEVRNNFTKPEIRKFLLTKVPKSQHDYINSLLNEAFPQNELNVMNTTQMWFRFVKIVGYLFQVCSDELFVNKFSESGRNIYYYEYSHKPSNPLLFKTKNWFNLSDNFDETPFVFGYPMKRKDLFTKQEITLSENIMKLWTQFAKNGNPTENKFWPIFDPSKPQLLSLKVGSIEIKDGLNGFKCDKYFPMFYKVIKGKIKEINLKTLNKMEENSMSFLDF